MSGSRGKAQSDTDHETSNITPMPMTRIATERDPEFYFDDSPVVIQVESTLFCVHRYHLIKSETFSDMFNMPKGPTKGLEEGASPERPIVLRGVRVSDFRALLKVLYPVYFTNERPKCEPEIIVPAFRLAHMWNFSDLRAHLLPLVKDALGCVDKIVIARELGIQEWLVPAHVELCQRAESLTVEEGTKLGMHSTIMITRLREQFHLSQSAQNSGRAGEYCHDCVASMGVPGSTNCLKCSGRTARHFLFPATPPSTALLGDNAELENQVKKWVEAGCVTD